MWFAGILLDAYEDILSVYLPNAEKILFAIPRLDVGIEEMDSVIWTDVYTDAARYMWVIRDFFYSDAKQSANSEIY